MPKPLLGEALLRIHAQMEKKLIEALLREEYNQKLEKSYLVQNSLKLRKVVRIYLYVYTYHELT